MTHVLFETSSPVCPQRVGMLVLDPANLGNSSRIILPRPPRSQLIYGARSASTDDLPANLQNMKWRIFTHVPAQYAGNMDTGSSQVSFESILVLPPPKKSSSAANAKPLADLSPVKTTATVTAVAATVGDGAVMVQAADATLLESTPQKEQKEYRIKPVASAVAVSATKESPAPASASAPSAPNTPPPSNSTPRSGKQLSSSVEVEADAGGAADTALPRSIPLILVPHGGPHGCTPTSWVPSYAYLALSLGAGMYVYVCQPPVGPVMACYSMSCPAVLQSCVLCHML